MAEFPKISDYFKKRRADIIASINLADTTPNQADLLGSTERTRVISDTAGKSVGLFVLPVVREDEGKIHLMAMADKATKRQFEERKRELISLTTDPGPDNGDILWTYRLALKTNPEVQQWQSAISNANTEEK